MENTSVNFKQKRDFGEVINATFAFIGQEYRLLGKAILFYVVPILVISAILSVLLGIEQQKLVNSLKSGDIDLTISPFAMVAPTYKYTLLSLVISLLGLSVLRCIIYGYISVYIQRGKDQFTLDDVWAEAKKFVLPILGTSIVIGLLVGVGFVCCILPGIWLGVSLSLIYMAMIYEGKGMGDAFNRSFNLTKDNWWSTFGIIIIAFIIVYILQLLLSIPSILMGFKSFFSAFKNPGNLEALNFTTSFYIISSITQLFTYFLFTIPFIALAFQYFNLVETKERPSLQDKIDQIG
jgi:hypothetical protein